MSERSERIDQHGAFPPPGGSLIRTPQEAVAR